MAESIFRIELAHENPMSNGYYYSYLDLPAEDHEIRDALQKARITGEGFRGIRITNGSEYPSLKDVRLDSPTIDELNFLARRIQAMSWEERVIYEAITQTTIEQGEPVSMKDLINCTYGLNKVPVIGGISDDATLGEFIIDGELDAAVNAVPKESQYLLDLRKVGEKYRVDYGIQYNAGVCVLARDYEMPEVYDGQQLPEEPHSMWYAFRLLVGAPLAQSHHRADLQWLSLPVNRKEADRIAAQYGKRRIENCEYYSFNSSVQQFKLPMIGSMREFEKLNGLALRMLEMSPEEQVKFKAVLYAEKPVGIDAALDVAGNLHQYEMDTAVSDDDEFFKKYLAHHLDSHFDKTWLNTLYVSAEGGRLLRNLGAMVTDYGAISARGRSLYELVPYDISQTQCTAEESTPSEDEQEQMVNPQFGGM